MKAKPFTREQIATEPFIGDQREQARATLDALEAALGDLHIEQGEHTEAVTRAETAERERDELARLNKTQADRIVTLMDEVEDWKEGSGVEAREADRGRAEAAALKKERDDALARVAALREVLEGVLRARGHGFIYEAVTETLADTAAAGQAFVERIEDRAFDAGQDAVYAELSRLLGVAVLDRPEVFTHLMLEGALAEHDARIAAEARQAALDAMRDEIVAQGFTRRLAEEIYLTSIRALAAAPAKETPK